MPYNVNPCVYLLFVTLILLLQLLKPTKKTQVIAMIFHQCETFQEDKVFFLLTFM